ncbi:High choriolytic enzyme 1-like [Fragilaria crotonensis]|nr:High choriolytic enzyme 1-like [Fragilaria crotonensis]
MMGRTPSRTRTNSGLRRMKGTTRAAQHPPHAMHAVGTMSGYHQRHDGTGRGDPASSSSSPTTRGEGGEQLFEGDIVPDYESIVKGYGPKVAHELEEKGLIVKGKSSLRQADVSRRWETRVNGVAQVPYAYSGQHNADAVVVIENALRDLEARSKVVKFVPRTTESDYIMVVDGDSCSSYVGRQGGEQPVTLSSGGCVTHGIVQHEFLHALGFNHEQSRPDRDEYVRINFENIDPAMAYNFDKRTETDSLGSPYDYSSVMHYGKADFSGNGGDTITAPQAIGQRDGADDEDIRQVVLLYQCESGARSLDEFLASPCTQDCKCWEGASSCNGDSSACRDGLECSASNQCAAPTPAAPPVVAPSGGSPSAPIAPPTGGSPSAPIAPPTGGSPSSPVAPPTGGSPSAPVAGGTCGFGSVGNGVCSDPGLCCSAWGWCGSDAEYCGF